MNEQQSYTLLQASWCHPSILDNEINITNLQYKYDDFSTNPMNSPQKVEYLKYLEQ
jgi:hypothetical protein